MTSTPTDLLNTGRHTPPLPDGQSRRPYTPAECTKAVGDTLRRVAEFITTTGLPIGAIEVGPAGQGWRLDPETWQWVNSVEVITVTVPRQGTYFLDWCDALNVTRIGVKRRQTDICLSAMVRRNNLDWHLSGGIWGTTSLPGADVQWYPTTSGRRSADGVCTVAGLRVAYERLSVNAATYINQE